MTPNKMLSSRMIAQAITDGNMQRDAALKQGRKTIQAREGKLSVFSHLPQAPEPGIGSLCGVGVGVKDIFDTHDMPTSYGSRIYPDHQPVADAALVRMLRNAGATIVGKTVTTEFAWFTPGPTRNPHNPAFSPGGSSSGSAAGLAAGYFPAAIGSQTGGSIIRPAAFCGVSGYKPSFRLFPTTGMKQFSWSLDTVGFFAASAADNAFVAAACSGRDLKVNEGLSTPPKIGIYKSSIDGLMDSSMLLALRHMAHRAKAHGATVVNVRGTKAVENARAAHAPIQGFEARLALGDELSRNPKKLSRKLRDYLHDSRHISADSYDDARRTANRARKACHGLFDKCDVLLLPSAPGTAPRTIRSTGNSIFNQLWTLMGLPCVNVAVGTGADNLPLGVQVIAPFGRDEQALQAAHWLETVLKIDGDAKGPWSAPIG